MTNSKTYFVSDVHLGAPALSNNSEREKLFVQWLDDVSKDAAAIYLMGDIFDFWFEYKKVAPRGFVRTLGKIAEITDKGIPVYFFTGNHDVWVFDYLPSETGVVVQREAITTVINNHKFFLAHGDGLDPDETGYLLLKRLFTSKIAQFFFSLAHPNVAFWFGHKWAKHSRLSKGTQAEETKGLDFEKNVTFAKKFLERENIDFFIFGHRHVLMNEKIAPNSSVVMLGEWFNYFSYAVFDGEKMELKKYNKLDS